MRTSVLVLAAVLSLLPLLAAGFFPEWFWVLVGRLGVGRLALGSAALCLPYALVRGVFGGFSGAWFAVYLLLSPGVIGLVACARRMDPEERGTLVDALVVAALGLAVDLRWMERAWPPHFAVFNKMLLLDVGVLGFAGARRLEGVGFDLRLRARDLWTGGREFLLYAPAAVLVGLWTGFLHLHRGWPRPGAAVVAAVFTFFFIAVPEELFFRGWMQNLLERRLGRWGALAVTSVLFGLAHFNKRAVHFNWRYVLLAALAGVFYGRAWRRDRRVGASAVTHTLVDTVWSLLLR